MGMILGSKMEQNPPTIESIPVFDEAELPPGSFGQGTLEELIRYIEAKYVGNIDKDYLVNEAIESILKNLDPHSAYFTPDEVEQVNNQLDGTFEGIGIESMFIDDTIIVSGIMPGSPAEVAGIMINDRIIEIQDSLNFYKKLTPAEIHRILKGKVGSKFIIGILRNSERELRRFTVIRNKIPLNSIETAYMLDQTSGYIRIGRFSSRTFEEFMDALDHLVEKQGMKNLVLDIRQNPGGYLQEATNILSQFFPEKHKLLVYTEGRAGKRVDYKTTGRALYDLGNIAVLVDEGSASASEIIAGAVQDWDRGVIIGRRTYGKGLVQEQYMLRNGSALRLTVAKYFTPSGRCIQKPYSEKEYYHHDLIARIESGEVYDESLFENPDTTRYFTQKGRPVFSGGGIQPDLFIPMNPELTNPYFIRLKRYVSSFAFQFCNSSDSVNIKSRSLEEFIKGNFPESVVEKKFLDFVLQEGEVLDKKKWQKVRKEILTTLQSAIARNFWAEEGYTKVINQNDPAVKEAISILKEKDPILKAQLLHSSRNQAAKLLGRN
jgi:carboxyl-terminal processing protease